MSITPIIHFHRNDLPNTVKFTDSVAVDTESMGLLPQRDRLCLVQLSAGDGVCHLVQIIPGVDCPNLKALLKDQTVEKIFHFAPADVAAFYVQFGVMTTPIYCTKIASRLVRTYTSGHSLKDLLRELLSIDVSKEQQTSDWGAETLSEEQQAYAATDVLYLHQLKAHLDLMLSREKRTELARKCFDFLSTRIELNQLGYEAREPFTYK